MSGKPPDDPVWTAYLQTVAPLAGRAPRRPPPAIPAPVAQLPPPARPAPSPPRVGQPPPGLDRASWRRFRLGQIRPARTLDLHGLTAAAAHRATLALIQRAHAEGARCVEIVTGKGDILARELPLWLESPPLRALVLALAHPHAANTGAVRVLLRRCKQ